MEQAWWTFWQADLLKASNRTLFHQDCPLLTVLMMMTMRRGSRMRILFMMTMMKMRKMMTMTVLVVVDV